MKNILLFITILTASLLSYSQVGINANGSSPNSSAGLDVDFTNRGILMPRMTTVQRDAIQNPALSLLIYNTTSNCYESYNGILWQSVFCLCTAAPDTPGIIIGSATSCEAATNISYSIVGVSGATSYTWYVPAGASISAGQGGTSILVNFGNTSGNIQVVANNSCGISSPSSLSVTLSGAPNTPGSITGNTTPCTGALGVPYSVTPVPGATSYSWSVPSGATITSGQGTSSIAVDFGSISGSVSVTAENSCGTSLSSNASVTLGTIPSIPGAISGNATPCANSSGNVYTISPVAGATFYTWTVPAGATVTSPQGNTSATVTFGSVSGLVQVTADNTCGSSNASGLSVTLGGGVTGTQTFSYTGSITSFTVPSCVSSVTIEAWGAEGGRGKESGTSSYSSGTPGKGARMKGTVTVTPGETLKVLVGQKGGEKLDQLQLGGGGGGGSFVTRNDNTPLVIAGGGGGSGRYDGNNGTDGTTNTSGTNGNGLGGSGGSGGSGGTMHSCSYSGGGGAGLTGAGQNHGGTNAQPFISGGAGASASTEWINGNVGGFGGGAGTGPHGGGGGGGYSGGGGGGDTNCGGNGGGGGGGSYNGGTNQSNSSGVQSGNGQVIINW
ncbi:MAG: hypothetical protein IT223_02725 [Crocinitomicaceae bacterium]|nr:hypothetical protein [Crocinitomicaceae bacterium]